MKMSRLSIIVQLLNGFHLEKEELERAKKIIHGLNIELERRLSK